VSGVAITRLTLTKISAVEIPLPPLANQRAIVAEMDAEQGAGRRQPRANRRMEKKIQSNPRPRLGEEDTAPSSQKSQSDKLDAGKLVG